MKPPRGMIIPGGGGDVHVKEGAASMGDMIRPWRSAECEREGNNAPKTK